MESIFPIFGGVIFGVVFLSFGVGLYFSSRQAPEEKGLTPLHTGRYGGWIDWWQMSWPFVRLSLYEDFCIIGYAGFQSPVCLRYSDIREFKRRNLLVSYGFGIKHCVDDVPGIIIWAAQKEDADKVIQLIENKRSMSGASATTVHTCM